MGRSRDEWIGKHADQDIPDRVRDRIRERAGKFCESCGGLLIGQAVEIDHIIALINWTGEGHGNRESNLQAVGAKCCHKDKTRRDVAEKSRAYKKRIKLRGLKKKKPRNPMPGSRASGWKRKLDGTCERRGS